MTILDVGAHIGFYSSLLSRLVGTSGHIESFEPTPWTFSLLKKNAGDSRNVTLNNVALANSEGRLEFSDYGPGFGAYNSASQDGAFINKPHRTISVPALTLDGFCAKNHITPDLIKIDAEGLEYSILQGMTTIIRSVRPLITLEMANGEAWAEGCAKASQLLLDNSYAAYEMEDDGHIKPHQMQHSYEYTNILFVPKEKTQSITDFIK
jgi:FkbM family methyltransferase